MHILLTGFSNTSAQQLLSFCSGEYDILILPNDKVEDARLLKEQLLRKKYDLICCIGQKPNIKDRVSIETMAKNVDSRITTRVNCVNLAQLFLSHGIPAKISENAGTSYCNSLYWSGLSFADQMRLNVAIVFIHIPFEKNIRDFNAFSEGFLGVMKVINIEGVVL